MQAEEYRNGNNREEKVRKTRPKRRWAYCVAEDMQKVGAAKEDAYDRGKWRKNMSTAATPHGNENNQKNNKKQVEEQEQHEQPEQEQEQAKV